MPVVSDHTLQSARDALAVYFDTEWALSLPRVDIAWTNTGFDPQARGVRGKGYVSWRFELGDDQQMTLGDPRRRRQFGAVMIDYFHPRDEGGVTPALERANDIQKIFAGRTIENIRIRSVDMHGPIEIDDWIQVSMICPFDYDYHQEVN